MSPEVAIIILNWNGWKDTIECLESLYQIEYNNYNVIVIDNASEDDSIERIKEYCNGKISIESDFFNYTMINKPVEVFEYTNYKLEKTKIGEKYFDLASNRKLILIKNDKNYGFTEGNNIGMKFALKSLNPDYLLLLNNDTVVKEDFLDELVNAAEEGEKIGFAGPKIYYYDFNGRKDIINFAGGNQNLWKFKPSHIGYKKVDNGKYDKNKMVDYVHGCCMLVNVEVIKEIGFLDKKYVSYREENDWAIRALKKGWISLYVFKSEIWHKVAASTSKTDNLLVHYLETRNRFLFVKKNSNKWQKISFMIYFFAFDFWLLSAVFLLYFRNINKYKCFLKAIKDGINI